MQTTNRDTSNIDLSRVLQVLRHRAPVVVICVVLTTAAAFVVSKRERKQYTASASIVFNNEQLSQEAAGLPAVASSDPTSVTDTDVQLAQLPRIAAATATAVGHGLTGARVQSSVSVSEQGDTSVVNIAATADSPTLAAELANTYSSQAISYRRASDQSYYTHALAAVDTELRALRPAQRRGIQGTDLSARANSLQLLRELQGNEVQSAQRAAVPTSPSSPKVARNTLLGLALGLFLGIALALLLERLDRRLRAPTDLEEVYRMPLIGVVPDSSQIKHQAEMPDAALSLSASEAEVFGLLRAHIRYFNVDRDLRVVMVVSAIRGEGKTTVARNLALADADIGARVLLLELDLRRPVVAAQLGVKQAPGVAEVLIGAVPVEDAVRPVKIEASVGAGHTVDVLVAGGVAPPNPAQVIESKAMSSVLDWARARYDLVVVDTPPLTVVSDAFPLLRAVDGVVVVGRLEYTRRDVATDLREALASAEAPVIGVCANGQRQRGSGAYGYGYGYGGAKSDREETSREKHDTAASARRSGTRDGLATVDRGQS